MVSYHVPKPFLDFDNLKMPKEVKIYDRTLRGIVQTTGKSIPGELKADLTKKLSLLGVDVIEVGIPFLSDEEYEGFKAASSSDIKTKLSALARTNKEDIKKAYEVGADRVYTFMATSEFHIKNIIKSTHEEIMSRSVSSIKYIKELGMECEFTIRDAMNSDFDFLAKFIENIEKAGIDVINIADTVAITTPRSVYSFISRIKKLTDIPISVHFHDDFGMATANALAAVEAGAEQIHCAVLGWSERAGMPPTEEIGVALKQLYKIGTSLNLEIVSEIADFLSEKYNIPIPPNKAIVGHNAFLYEVGPYFHSNDGPKIIQFEPYPPELVGRDRAEKPKGF